METNKINKEVNYLIHESVGSVSLIGSVFYFLSKSNNLDEKELKQIEIGKKQLKRLQESLDYFYKQMKERELV